MKSVRSCPHRILIAIRFLTLSLFIFCLFFSFDSWCFGDSEFQSIIFLIDNSKSMSMTDIQKWRWSSAEILVNRLQIGQWVCVMGFADSVLPVIRPTQIIGSIEQKSQLERKLSVPFNEKEKKGGILSQALFSAEKTFQSMSSSEPQALILITDDKAEFTREEWKQFLKNSSNRKSFVLTTYQDKSISVSNGQKRSHNNLLTAFLYAVNDIDGYQLYEQKKIVSKQHIFLHDPRIENLELQFTSSQKRKPEIEIKDSQGNHIFPYFETSYCTSYWIPQPSLGYWQVSLDDRNQVELLAFKKEKPSVSIGQLEFVPPPLSYVTGREIDLQIRLVAGKHSFNQVHGKVIRQGVEEEIVFLQTADQTLYVAKYVPKEAGKHKFIIDPSRDYITNPPIRTVELEMSQFPVWMLFSVISGGIGIGGIVLLLFVFLRRRSTRNEVEDGETDDETGNEIEINPRAEISELHSIIAKQKKLGVSDQQEVEQKPIPNTAEKKQQDLEGSSTQSIEGTPTVHAQGEVLALPVEPEGTKPVDGNLNQKVSNDDAFADLSAESESLELEDFDNVIKPMVEEVTLGSEEVSAGFGSENEISEGTVETKDTLESNQDNVLSNQQIGNEENQNTGSAEPDIIEDTSINSDVEVEDPMSEDESLATISEVHSDSDIITSPDEEEIEVRNNTVATVQTETSNKQQIDEPTQQSEDEGIDWYIGKFLSDIQNIVDADSLGIDDVAMGIVDGGHEDEDPIQGLDDKQVEEFNQESDVNQDIDKILTEIEVLSRE